MREKNSALIGNLACFTAYAIFGFNIISCKSIAIDGNITPMALFCLRSFGATALFWIWSLFTAPREHIERKDVWKVVMYSGRYPFSVPVIPVHFLGVKTDYLLRS